MGLKQVVAKRSHAPASGDVDQQFSGLLATVLAALGKPHIPYLSQGNSNSVSKSSNSPSGSFYKLNEQTCKALRMEH